MSLETKGSMMSKLSSRHSTPSKLTSKASTTTAKTEPLSQLDKDEKLFLYACDGNLSKVHKWLNLGANIHSRIVLGRSPIIGAASNGNEQVVQYLIECGSNVDDHDNSGLTALMLAVIHGFPWIVEILLQCGADSKPKDKRGKTAMDYASGSSDMKELLAQYQGIRIPVQPKRVRYGSGSGSVNHGYDVNTPMNSLLRQESRSRNALDENSYGYRSSYANSFAMGGLGL